jgi:hypothetical protein
MSYIFENEDKSLWAPSNTVADLFLSQLQQLANLINMETGFTETMGMVFEVNQKQLGKFLAATANCLNKSNNRSFKVFLRPVVIHLIAIYLRFEDSSSDLDFTSFERDWLEESKLFAKSGMPR